MKDPEYLELLKERLPDSKDEDFDRLAELHTKGLENADEWAEKHIEAYESWERLLDNELSNKTLNQWQSYMEGD